MSEHDNDIRGLDDGARDLGSVDDWPAPGEKLRTLREERGITQAEVAQALHLTVHYINALEQDQYDKMPGKVFVKGYFRNYAALLDVDADKIVNWYERYARAQGEDQAQPIQPLVRSKPRYQDQSRYLLLGGTLVIVLFIGLSWWFSSRSDDNSATDVGFSAEMASRAEQQREEETAAALVANKPDAQNGRGENAVQQEPATVIDHVENQISPDWVAEAEPQLPVQADTVPVEDDTSASTYKVGQTAQGQVINLTRAGGDVLDVHLIGHSWVEINDANDERLFSDLLTQGDELHIQARAPFNILLGDARQVGIFFNRRKIDLERQVRSDNSARIILTP